MAGAEAVGDVDAADIEEPKMRPRKPLDDELVHWLREWPLAEALRALELHVVQDVTFEPVKDRRTQRWVVSGGGGTFQLLVTGMRWYDATEERGGGGAIDLVMHLERLDFVRAVRRLSTAAAAARARGGLSRERTGQGPASR